MKKLIAKVINKIINLISQALDERYQLQREAELIQKWEKK